MSFPKILVVNSKLNSWILPSLTFTLKDNPEILDFTLKFKSIKWGFHLFISKAAIKTKPVFKRCCHIGILSSPWWVHSFWADKGIKAPLNPLWQVVQQQIPIFVTETQASSVTPIKYIQDISSFISYSHPIPHFEFDFCCASCNRNQLMPVSITQGIYWSMDWVRQRRFSVAQIPENMAKCKTTFWV